jgi:hypothetical protein
MRVPSHEAPEEKDAKADECEKVMHGIERVLRGHDIDVVAPVLVMTVARVLYNDAGNDPMCLARNMFKFIDLLGSEVAEMAGDEGLGEPRQ